MEHYQLVDLLRSRGLQLRGDKMIQVIENALDDSMARGYAYALRELDAAGLLPDDLELGEQEEA